MNKQYTIAVDVDGTTLNLMKVFLEIYNLDYHDTLTEDAITSWDITQLLKPEARSTFIQYFEDPSLYYAIEPYPYALEAVKLLKFLGHRVVFATSSTVGASGAKYKKLKELGFLDDLNDYMEVKDKSLIRANFLIDDGMHNILAFKSGASILIERPWNCHENHSPKVKNWEEVATLFRIMAEKDK